MPLNYSKWDNLELSDDSDIEVHPNVDKKSMIRWKQRDIHEKREQRKLLIAKLKSELDLNAVLRPRIESVITGVESKGVSHYRAVQRRIKEQPSDEKPNTGAPNQPTYDMMLGQLLSDVWREAAWLVDGDANVENGIVLIKGAKVDEKTGEPTWASAATVPDVKEETMAQALTERLKYHVGLLDQRNDEIKKEIADEEADQAKKITSDGIHDGFNSSAVSKAAPSPLDKPKPAPKKENVETIEVLNPGASSSATAPKEEDEIIGPLTESAKKFVNIPLGDFEQSYKFIQKDSSVLSSETHDALLLEAFEAQRRALKAKTDSKRKADEDLAKRCIHQSLIIEYCRELGGDGVKLFFQRMITKNPKSIEMFTAQFRQTYEHVVKRSKVLSEEAEAESGDKEVIQLVAQDPNVKIGFNIPDGPPPEDLRIEGEGADQLDIEQVRAFLQHKWEIFSDFPLDLQEALKTEQLDAVNNVLEKMSVRDAEKVVEDLQEGGMLSFSEEGVRDMTQQ